jgi:hypothetical protein
MLTVNCKRDLKMQIIYRKFICFIRLHEENRSKGHPKSVLHMAGIKVV